MNVAFQPLDIAIVVFVLISAVYATYRGFVAESLSVFAWIAAAVAMFWFGPWVASWMYGVVEPEWLSTVVGWGLVFIVVLLPIAFASARFAESVKKTHVGTLDSALGAAFGVARGLVVVGIAYLLFTAFWSISEQPDWITRARLMPVVRASAEVVASLIPDQHVRVRERERDPIAEKLEESPARTAPPPRKTVESAPVPAPRPAPAKHAKKTYGARDRHALDKLIETSGDESSGKP